MTASDQSTFWNGAAGRAWVEEQRLLDTIFARFETLLADAVVEGDPRRVLDVGCGTGATTLAVARRLGADAVCTGVDISEPMVEGARRRAAEAKAAVAFVHANAATHAFAPAGFDRLMSRFGVMFFEEPEAAFANLRRAAADGAEARFVTWRGPRENPFMTTAERAAAPLLPALPVRAPDAPGQFGLADAERTKRIFQAGGWSEVEVRALDVLCAFPASELHRYVMRLGPLGRLLESEDEATRSRVTEAVLPAFDAYVQGDEVRFEAACWMIAARA